MLELESYGNKITIKKDDLFEALLSIIEDDMTYNKEDKHEYKSDTFKY